jgi:iron complex outermembrane receptor protein
MYDGLHFGEVIDVPLVDAWQAANSAWRYYEGNSLKLDGNVYWKNTVALGKNLHVFADVQVRNVDYTTNGTDNDLRTYDVDFQELFFNPKGGVTFSNGKHKAYASVAYAGKEPNRNDFVDAIDPSQVRSEFMLNTEVGYGLTFEKFSVRLNAYSMEYKDQLVLTGALNDVGAPVRVNVPNSYRRGLELEAGMQLPIGFFVEGNLTRSENRISEFTDLIYDYDVVYSATVFRNAPIAFSPDWTGAAQLGWSVSPKKLAWMKKIEIAWISKYVSDQFLDNTGNRDRILPSYWVQDLRGSFDFNFKKLPQFQGIDCWVNNALNRAYVSNGYTYSYYYNGMITERFYYPQAPIHFMVAARFKIF